MFLHVLYCVYLYNQHNHLGQRIIQAGQRIDRDQPQFHTGPWMRTTVPLAVQTRTDDDIMKWTTEEESKEYQVPIVVALSTEFNKHLCNQKEASWRRDNGFFPWSTSKPLTAQKTLNAPKTNWCYSPFGKSEASRQNGKIETAFEGQ